MIDEGEAKHALKCAEEWGFINAKEAKRLAKEGKAAAGADGKLSLEESGATDEPLFAQVESGDDSCGPKPAVPEGFSEKDLFHEIAGEDGMIDKGEAEHALKCAEEWGFINAKEAKRLAKEGTAAAGADGKLSLEESGATDEPLFAQVESGDESSCGTAPAVPEGFTEKDLFREIAGTDGEIDEGEAKHALKCAVEWGFLDAKEAKKIAKKGKEAAGADGKLSLEESGATDKPLKK
jgi:hypothetical protein